MRTKRIGILLTILMSMVATKAFAYDIAAANSDGETIYYNYINDGKELEVTSVNPNTNYQVAYTNVVIPEEVTYMDMPLKVTAIGKSAFEKCTTLKSVTIPNSVISIGESAFYYCIKLTSIDIPNSVTTIGKWAFKNSGLTSVNIPNSVNNIGIAAFAGTGLTSVTIPNSVTYINDFTFTDCTNLKSIDIPNSITSIGANAFENCISLISITIPNSVTYVQREAFKGCKGLSLVVIGNGVDHIYDSVFDECDLLTVVSYINNPFTINDYVFTSNTYSHATLYVPAGTIDRYKATDGWKRFVNIEEGTWETAQCEKPTISYQNGMLSFYCATEGATCKYNITDSDIKAGSANEVQLDVTYNISVYATKSGYVNSEIATATLCWIDVAPQTEGITSVAKVRANAVMIKADNGIISIEGAEDGMNVSVYTIDGVQEGSAIIRNGAAMVNTNIPNDSVAIVKIGNKSVKVVMK